MLSVVRVEKRTRSIIRSYVQSVEYMLLIRTMHCVVNAEKKNVRDAEEPTTRGRHRIVANITINIKNINIANNTLLKYHHTLLL